MAPCISLPLTAVFKVILESQRQKTAVFGLHLTVLGSAPSWPLLPQISSPKLSITEHLCVSSLFQVARRKGLALDLETSLGN